MNKEDILADLEEIKEFAYYPDPRGVGLFLLQNYADKKLALYRESEHAFEVVSVFKNANIISLMPKDGFITMDEAKGGEYDFIVLLGWWPDQTFLSFCEDNDVDCQKILRPYHDNAFRGFSRSLAANSIDADFLNLSTEKPNIILFVFADIKDFISRHSKYLKDEFNIIKIYIHPIEKATEDNSYFAQTIFCDFNFHKFTAILSKFKDRIDAVAMHLPASLFWIFVYLKAHLEDIKFINFLTESQIITYGNYKDSCIKKGRLTDASYDYFHFCEKAILSQSDAVVTNLGDVMLDVFSEYNNNVVFLECPFGVTKPDNFDTETITKENINYSFVYAGGAVNNKMLPGGILEEDVYLPPVFEVLLQQNFSVDCFLGSGFINDLDSLKKSGIYSNYFELETRYQNFKMQPTMPHKDHVRVMERFDFGIMLHNLNDTNFEYMEAAYASIVHSKMFSYLSAGLPIILNKELKAQAKFVEQNKLGIAVDRRELNNLKDILKNIDYAELKNSVKKFISEYESKYAKNTAAHISEVLKKVIKKNGA